MALKLDDLTAISSAQIDEVNDYIPVFDESANVLKKTPVNSIAATGITSFNTRTGTVNPAEGDYSIGMLSASGTEGQIPALNSQGKLQMTTPAASAVTTSNVNVTHPSGTHIPSEVSTLQQGLNSLFETNFEVSVEGTTLVFTVG